MKDTGEPVPSRVNKIFVNIGPPLLFYIFSNWHFLFYEFLLGNGYVK